MSDETVLFDATLQNRAILIILVATVIGLSAAIIGIGYVITKRDNMRLEKELDRKIAKSKGFNFD